MTIPEIAVLAAHMSCLGLLVCLGFHRCWLVVLRRRHPLPPAPAPTGDGGDFPLVTLQLPIYNERRVAGRLLRAVAELDWPAGRLEVQILDDSTDATRRLAAAGARLLETRGILVEHVRRRRRDGFKAGALEAGRERARGELLAVFDADFVPPSDFLRRMVPAFADPRVGMVQARWDHLNRRHCLLTRVQALLLDGHFAVEHAARAATGCFFNFNGTAGIWRAACLEDAGGWSAVTLTEDLDLSYRAQLAGWRFRYLDEVRVPAELPPEVEAFKGQQSRWAQGSMQTARLLLPRILRAPLPVRLRVEALFHLGANLCYPALLGLALLLFPAQEIRYRHGLGALAWVDFLLLAGGIGGLAVFHAAAGGRRGLGHLPSAIALGAGLAVTNAVAVARGLLSSGGVFHRTPKVGGGRRRTYVAAPSLTPAAELALGGYLVAAAVVSGALGMWPGIPFLALFGAGFLWMGAASCRPWLAAGLRATRRAIPVGSGGFRGLRPDRAPWVSPAAGSVLPSEDR